MPTKYLGAPKYHLERCVNKKAFTQVFSMVLLTMISNITMEVAYLGGPPWNYIGEWLLNEHLFGEAR